MRAPTSAHKIGPLLVSAWALVVIAGAGGCGSSAPLTPSIDDAGVTGSDGGGDSGAGDSDGSVGAGGVTEAVARRKLMAAPVMDRARRCWCRQAAACARTC